LNLPLDPIPFILCPTKGVVVREVHDPEPDPLILEVLPLVCHPSPPGEHPETVLLPGFEVSLVTNSLQSIFRRINELSFSFELVVLEIAFVKIAIF